MKIQRNVDLGKKTSIWVWSISSYFTEINSKEDLIDIFKFIKKKSLWIIPIWFWSNVFFYNNIVDKVIVKLRNNNIDFKSKEKNFKKKIVNVWAWVILQKLIFILAKEWLDMSQLSWYPSTLWWAIAVNSGLLWKSISDYLICANLFNFKTWKFENWIKSDFNFIYRSSRIKSNNKYLIFDCVLKIPIWINIQEKIKKLIKEKKLKQPSWKCSGCFFKNPDWNYAWELIDRAWLKWLKIWWAYISKKHANFLMTNSFATKEDLFSLKELIKNSVFKKFWIKLEEEVVIY